MERKGGSRAGESHQPSRHFSDRGNCSSSGLRLYGFLRHPFTLLIQRARFSLGQSLTHKSLHDTWEALIAAAFTENARRKLATLNANMTSARTAACHLTAFVLFPSGGIK